MTEEEWLACADPDEMLYFIRSETSERKERLFECACCRRIEEELEDERSRQAIAVAERKVEGLATEAELEAASALASVAWDMDLGKEYNWDTWDGVTYSYAAAAYNITVPMGWWGGAPAFRTPSTIIREAAPDMDFEGIAQCHLARDIFGNPFRPVVADPAWLTPAAVSIAAAIYEDRPFERLPVLADALEESGCAHADVLLHCRTPAEHVRGCWVVDLVLGKE